MSYPSAQPLVTAQQLGQLLKAARKQRKLTQAHVAGRLGLSQNRVSHLELHPDQLSFKQLLAWCAAVGLQLQLAEPEASPTSATAEW